VRRHQGAGLATYLAEYLAFATRASVALARAHRRARFGLVQVHSLPDFLAFAGLPTKLAGVPLLLDLHEAMPDFFRSRFGPRLPVLAARGVIAALGAQERASIALADAVITVNDALGARLLKRGVPATKLTIVPNSPSLRLFDPAAHPVRRFAEDGTVRLVYAGGLSPTYEVDVAIRALGLVTRARPDLDLQLEVYGRDFGEVPLGRLVADLDLGGRVRFHGRVALADVPAAIAAADIGLAPTRRTSFTDNSLSTKVFEYAAMGKPVVASDLPLVAATFGDAVLAYEPGSAEAMAAGLIRLVDDARHRAALVGRARAVVESLAWERVAERYLALVDRLVSGRPS
jgi:glycosyltransferase involved in cell wall biosynthesis